MADCSNHAPNGSRSRVGSGRGSVQFWVALMNEAVVVVGLPRSMNEAKSSVKAANARDCDVLARADGFSIWEAGRRHVGAAAKKEMQRSVWDTLTTYAQKTCGQIN